MLAVYDELSTTNNLIGKASHADDDTRRCVALKAMDHLERALMLLESEM
tara:strand:- start:77 stop:223 length:147 start_codon:yes stop_codon:yes gene_type:complete